MIQPERQYSEFLRAGRFMLLRNPATGKHIFQPRVMDPETGSTDLEWVEASGLGTVHSVTIVRQRDPANDYNVVLVDLDEGVRMMSRVEGLAPDAVEIGLRVKAHVQLSEEFGGAVVFTPLAAGD